MTQVHNNKKINMVIVDDLSPQQLHLNYKNCVTINPIQRIYSSQSYCCNIFNTSKIMTYSIGTGRTYNELEPLSIKEGWNVKVL